jgi:PAS domain S-box-containing protein
MKEAQMIRSSNLFKGSIINKVILLSTLILISVGGILFVNTISFFGVKDSLELMIDRDVEQIVENIRLNDNFRNSIVLSDLLIQTFVERENTLKGDKDRLIGDIKADIKSLKLDEGHSKAHFQEYLKKLNELFTQCITINENLKEVNSIEKSLNTRLASLDEIVVEKELTIAVEDSEEAESIRQLGIMLPGYREILFEIILEFSSAKTAYLGIKEIKENYEGKIRSLMEEFDIGLHAMPIAWNEMVPYVQNLMELTSQFQSQIATIFINMRKFHDHLAGLKNLEKQVVAEISIINNRIIKNTHDIRRKTSENITSSIKTTIFLSSIIILILSVLGVLAVRLVQPIKRLSIGAAKIGAGDLNYKVKLESNDEIGQLADEFNRMTSNLHKTTVSREYVQNILTSMHGALIVLTPEGHIRTVNQAACDLSGYNTEELVGESVGKILGDIEDQNTIQKQLIEQKFIKNNEKTFVGKDGHKIPVLFSASTMLSKDQSIQGIVCVASDITELRQIEDELATEKERLTVTLRSIGDGVISTDLLGNIILVNKVAEELTGWKEEEAIGKPLSEVLHIVNEFSRERCEDPVRKVIKTGGIVGLANHTVLIGKHGKEFVIADSAAPIMDSQSKVIGAVLVFRDTTDKRKMEEELTKIQKLESLGVLAGGIAHDFNNFLTAIIGNLSLAKIESKPGDQIAILLDEMEKASLRAKNLTQQLLTFSRGGEPVKKLANLDELLKNAATFSLRGSNVRCEFSISEELLPVELDEGQIGQVINNLVLNADHAMPEGGIIEINADNINLTVDNEFSLPAGPYLRTSFRDHGVGIQPDHLNKVFDPYFTTKQKGSGLGLTVAYSIIDKHNGRLTAESKTGLGTTFTIYLPATETTASQIADEETHLFQGQGKILVMDDEEFIRDLAIRMLGNIGYEVSVASDGKKAFEIYRQAQHSGKPFDTVILDLTVPGGMGGKETIQKLTDLDPNVKALVSSGYSNDPILANYRDYGFQGVISKPYRIQDLSDGLRSVAKKKSG